MLRTIQLAALAAAAFLVSGCVTAKTVEFKWQNDDRRMVLMPTDIQLMNMTGGGVEVPNAEWTAKAEGLFLTSLRDKLSEINSQVIESDTGLDQPQEQVKLIKLHETVGATIQNHLPGTAFALPTMPENAVWTLGSSTHALKARYGADYALFVHVRDSYTSGDRAAAIFVGALFGVHMQGGTQRGFASLVDLRTGDVVWYNRLLRAKGDMRNAKGARETADALLRGFPG